MAERNRRQTNNVVPHGARVNSQGALHIPDFAFWQLNGSNQQRANVRSNAALPGEAWQSLDDSIVDIVRDQPDIVNDMRNAGMTTSVDMENEYIYWYKSRPRGKARVSMDPNADSSEVTASFERDGVPLPFIHDDFSIGIRQRPGESRMSYSADDMETYLAEEAAYNVETAMEDMVINGAPPELGSSDGFQVHGLLTHPDRNTGTFANDWIDDTSAIRSDFRQMIEDLKEDNFRGGEASYRVYLSTDYEEPLRDADPEGDGNRTIMDRVNELSEIDGISISQFMPEKTAVAVRFTSSVLDLAVAEDIQSVQWSDGPGFRDHFKTFMCAVPRIKSTMAGQCGIVHYTNPESNL